MARLAARTRAPRRPAARRPAQHLKVLPGGGGIGRPEHVRELIGLGLAAVGALLAVAMYAGAGGPVGAVAEQGVRLLVGRAALAVPVLLIAAGAAIILEHALVAAPPMRLGLALGAIALLGALAAGMLGGAAREGWFAADSVIARGGQLGEGVHFVLAQTVGGLGTAVVIGALGVAAAILISGASLAEVLRVSGRGAVTASRQVSRGVAASTANAVRETQRIQGYIRRRIDGSDVPTLVTEEAVQGRPPGPGGPLDGADAFADIFAEHGELPPSPAAYDSTGSDSVTDEHAPPARAAGPGAPPPAGRPVLRAVPPPAPAEPLHAVAAPAAAPPRGERPVYRLPSPRLLRRSQRGTGPSAALVERTSRELEEALGHFGIQATITNAVTGPRVTRYELQLAPGTKVSRVAALRDDLAYALAARDELRIIAPIPGKQAVGVEVPNPDARLVTLGDIFRELPEPTSPLGAWLGVDLGGKPVSLDIARMPHLLIAGSTGTGKSVCLNGILTSILLRATPDDLRMILIDPKKVELNHYESIPHLLTSVVTNMKSAAAVLSNVVGEMEKRYELMGMARARSLRDWNLGRERAGERPIPHMLVVIDELADLMMVAPAEVEDAIIRLAQKSRAVGIHLLLATQRPSVDVITGMIKANVPSRIAFAVSSQVDSRVVLDTAGAESLLGSGDMLYRPIGTSRLQRLQGAYVSEEEIREITDHWRRQGRPKLREEMLERAEPADDGAGPAESDEMVRPAIETVIQQGNASVSLLQRRLGVGYARAGRLIDRLEELGVVSSHEGSKPRRVLIGPGDLARLFPPEPDPAPDDPPGEPGEQLSVELATDEQTPDA